MDLYVWRHLQNQHALTDLDLASAIGLINPDAPGIGADDTRALFDNVKEILTGDLEQMLKRTFFSSTA